MSRSEFSELVLQWYREAGSLCVSSIATAVESKGFVLNRNPEDLFCDARPFDSSRRTDSTRLVVSLSNHQSLAK
jgi:hypothetical protein